MPLRTNKAIIQIYKYLKPFTLSVFKFFFFHFPLPLDANENVVDHNKIIKIEMYRAINMTSTTNSPVKRLFSCILT